MSFSGEMKEEIARLIPEKEEEVRAELMAIIRFCGRILRQEESVAVFMETENVVLAKTYVKLIKRAFDLQVQLEIRRHGTGKYNQYFILLSERPEDMLYSEERPERQKLQQALQAICMWSAQADPRGFLKTPGSMRAYIRGAFLCTGSMSDPGKSYHFEMVCEDEQTAQILKELMAGFFVHAKVILRKQRYIVYLKDSEEIIQILNFMEAHRSLMELENIRIIKDMRNSANRQSNCDSANINKMVRTAARQVDDIRYIEEHFGFEQLPPQLREMAQVRLENPDVSLQELGTYLDPPVGKSGVNHRLRKLKEIAESLRAGKEK